MMIHDLLIGSCCLVVSDDDIDGGVVVSDDDIDGELLLKCFRNIKKVKALKH